MYSDKLAHAVFDAQRALDKCYVVEKIAHSVAETFTALNELVLVIGIRRVDFTKRGYFNRLKIQRYWLSVMDAEPMLQAHLEQFAEYKETLTVTLDGLRDLLNHYSTVYDEFRNECSDCLETDAEALQQMATGDNMYMMLTNTLSEYTTLQEACSKAQVALARMLLSISLVNNKMFTDGKYTMCDTEDARACLEDFKDCVCGLYELCTLYAEDTT